MSDLQNYLDVALKKIKLNKPVEPSLIKDYDIHQEIAAMIASLRGDMNLTQGQLAKRSGVSQANISKFENGISQPSISTLKKMADGMGKRLIVRFIDKEVDF